MKTMRHREFFKGSERNAMSVLLRENDSSMDACGWKIAARWCIIYKTKSWKCRVFYEDFSVCFSTSKGVNFGLKKLYWFINYLVFPLQQTSGLTCKFFRAADLNIRFFVEEGSDIEREEWHHFSCSQTRDYWGHGLVHVPLFHTVNSPSCQYGEPSSKFWFPS